MKNVRIIALLIALITVFSVFSFTVSAQDVTKETETTTQAADTILKSGKWEYKKLSKTTAEIVSYLGNDKTCAIPEKIANLKVVSIASGAVKNKTNVTSLIIPGTVSTFREDSVIGCKKLKNISVSAGCLETFDIENCTSLEVINLSETVKSIGTLAGCKALKEINVAKNNKSLKSIGGVVYSASGKTLMKYPAGKKITRFTIPAGVVALADYAFYGVGTNVKEIFVPTAVVKMGAKTFSGAKCQLYFQASKLPSGCKTAVKGLTCKYSQINIFAPTKVASAQNSTAIKLTWKKVTGASGYVIYYKNSKGDWTKLSTTTKTAITIKSIGGKALTAGKKYTFAVKSAVKTSKGVQTSSNYTTHESATTPVGTSKIIYSAEKNSIKLMWQKVSGASGYAVYLRDSKGKLTLVTKTAKNVVTIKKLSEGTAYTYVVRTYIKTADAEIMGGYRVRKVATKGIAVPVVTAKQKDKSSLEFTWTRCHGASSYQVYYSVNGGKWISLATYNDAKKITIPGLSKGIKITLAVRAVKTEDGKVIRSGYKPVSVTMK